MIPSVAPMNTRPWVALVMLASSLGGCRGPGDLAVTIDASSSGSDAGLPDAWIADAEEVGGETPVGRLFQIIDPVEAGSGHGFVCPVGLCAWFGAPIGKGQRGGAIYAPDLPAPMPPRPASEAAWPVRVGPGDQASDLHLDIHGPAFPSVPYPDLSAYAGIAFWARSDLHGTEFTLAIEDDKVLALGYAEALDSGRPWFTRRVQIGSVWRRYVLLFDDFRQQLADGTVSDARVHTAAVWSFHFLNGLDGKPADYQFDDLALLCRGRCPKPAFDVPSMPEPEALDDSSLPWMSGSATDPQAGCAEIASLSMRPPGDWLSGPEERIVLRVRIKGTSFAEVPIWRWVVQRLPSGEELTVTTIDDPGTLVALPSLGPGDYRIRAHTHYPSTEVCGADLTLKL